MPVATTTARQVIQSSNENGAPAIASLLENVAGSFTCLRCSTENVSVSVPVVNVVIDSRSSVVQ